MVVIPPLAFAARRGNPVKNFFWIEKMRDFHSRFCFLIFHLFPRQMYYYASKKLFFRGLAAVALVLTTCPSGVASTTVAPLGEEEYYYDDHIETTFAPFDDDNINSFQPWINYGPDGEYNSDDGMYMDGGYDYGLYHDGGNYTTPSPMYGYDDGGWVATTGEYIDECGRLCAAFTAANRGNGYDLCENSTSHCQYSVSRGQHLCSSLYWQLLDDGSGNRGVFFETDESTLTASNDPLTCDEANEILHENGGGDWSGYSGQEYNDYGNNDRWIDYERPITHHLNTALQLFIHSSPIARRLAAFNNSENREFMYHLAQYANNTNGNTTDIIRQYLPGQEVGSVIGALTQLVVASQSIESFVSRFNLVGNSTCPYCHSTGREELVMGSLHVNITGAVDLQDALPRGLSYLLRDTRGCDNCGAVTAAAENVTLSLVQPGEVLALRLHRIGQVYNNSTYITIPQVLDISGIPRAENVTNTRYRLYAIVDGDITSETTVRINGQWFHSINGTNLTAIAPIEGPVVSNIAHLVLYEQM